MIIFQILHVYAISINQCTMKIQLHVCLFGIFPPTTEFLTSMKMSSLPVKGCKFVDLCSSLMALSSQGSFTCHTYCDTGHPFIMVISKDQ